MSTRACIICAADTGSSRQARCPAHRLRARPRGNAFEPIRTAVFQRDGYVCQLRLEGCTTAATHVDHIVPLAAGGTDDLDNLQAACAACNLRKGPS